MGLNDDLTAITGIGEAWARRLRDEFGIRSLEELAHASADDLERRLQEVGIAGASRAGIEAWIAQARELVARADEETPAPMTGADPGRPAVAPNGGDRWQAAAVFMVELQSEAGGEGLRTTVHHMEADTGGEWAGFDCDSLCAWLSARLPEVLRETLLVPPEEAHTEPPSSATRVAGPDDAAAVQRLSATVEADVIDGSVAQPVGQIAAVAPWAIDVRWTLSEALSADTGGEWLVRASFTPMGPGEPLAVLGEPMRVPPRPGESSYGCRMGVPAGAVTPANIGPTYCGVVVLTFEPGRPGIAPGAWFVELRPVQFHEPGR